MVSYNYWKKKLDKMIRLNSTRKLFQVDRKSVSFIRFIFEAYDGLANITTIDPVIGIIELNIAPGSESDADRLMGDLKKNMLIRMVDKRLKLDSKK